MNVVASAERKRLENVGYVPLIDLNEDRKSANKGKCGV
jgi:hypothetical protein